VIQRCVTFANRTPAVLTLPIISLEDLATLFGVAVVVRGRFMIATLSKLLDYEWNLIRESNSVQRARPSCIADPDAPFLLKRLRLSNDVGSTWNGHLRAAPIPLSDSSLTDSNFRRRGIIREM